MDNNQNNLNNNIPNSSVNQNTNPETDLNTNGMQNMVQDDYYNNNSYYSNSNYESNYSDTSYEEKKPKNNTWLKILIVILVLLIIIILLLKFCVGGGKSSDQKYTELKARICTAAETYVMNNPDLLDRTSPGKVATIKYQKLSDANLIETQIANPYYKGGLFSKSKENKYYSLDNTVRLTVASDLTLTCELVDNSQDVTAPVIRLNGDAEVTYAIGTEFQDPMATATDDYDGDLTDKIVRSGNVDLTKAGTYTLTYTVSDSAGNTSSIKRTIIYEEYPNLEVTLGSILDGVTPMISLKGSNPYCMVKGTKYVEPGATATDNVDGNITDRIAVTNKITGNLIGSFRVTYKVEDSSGNQAVAYRAVIVSTECPNGGDNDNTANTAPTITLVGKTSVTINIGTEYIDLGATAYDKEDGDLTNSIVTNDTLVNVNKAGVYKVLYKVTDRAGATTNAERTVTVKSAVSGNPSVRWTENKDNINVVVGEGNDNLLIAPKAVNENGTSVNVTNSIVEVDTNRSISTIDWNKEGKYRVVYTATHANGQVSITKTIIVTIFSDYVKIGGKDAINVNVRTSNCNITEADLVAGGVTFETGSSSTPIINLENNENIACKIGSYEVKVIAKAVSGVLTEKTIKVYVVNGTGGEINVNAPSQVIITKNTANANDPYNTAGIWVGGTITGITVDFTSTPVSGTTISKYQWSSDCLNVSGELNATSSTTGSLYWPNSGKNSVCIRAVTTAGIEGPWSNPVNLYIDTVGPGIVFTHTWADGKDDWHNSNSLTVSYKGIDEASGVDHFEYTFDDVKAKMTEGKENEIATTEITSNNLIVTENMEPLRSELFVFVRAVDKAGNKGAWVNNPAYANMDTIKPNNPTASVLENNTPMVKISATATDNNNPVTNRYSGIGSFKIRLVDMNNNLKDYSSIATMVKDGDKSQGGKTMFKMPTHFGEAKTYNVKVWAVDRAGNESEGYSELTATVTGGEATTAIKAVCPTGAINGKSGNVTVEVTPTNASERDFTYTSSDTNIATVDADGKVTYKAVGNVTITTKLVGSKGTLESTCSISISNPTSDTGYSGYSYSGSGSGSSSKPTDAETEIVYVEGIYGTDENGYTYVQAFEVPKDTAKEDIIKNGKIIGTYTLSSINEETAQDFRDILKNEDYILAATLNYKPKESDINASLGFNTDKVMSINSESANLDTARADVVSSRTDLTTAQRELAAAEKELDEMVGISGIGLNSEALLAARKKVEDAQKKVDLAQAEVNTANNNLQKVTTESITVATEVVENKATQQAVATVNNTTVAQMTDNYSTLTKEVANNDTYRQAWNDAQMAKVDSYKATMSSSTASSAEKAAAAARYADYMK